jgi:hypothetical protein
LSTSRGTSQASPARIATIVAVPVALVVGLLSLWRFGAFDSAAPLPSASPDTQSTAPVTMSAAPLSGAAAAVCRTVVANLPDAIRDLRRRPVSAGTTQNAAYGDPAITFACGGPAASAAPTDDVFPFSGVCWVARATPEGTLWGTVDRVVPIAVTVPGAPDGSGQSVVPLSPAVATNDPRIPRPPTGCG